MIDAHVYFNPKLECGSHGVPETQSDPGINGRISVHLHVDHIR